MTRRPLQIRGLVINTIRNDKKELIKGFLRQLEFDLTSQRGTVCWPEDSPPGPAPPSLGLGPSPPVRPGSGLGRHTDSRPSGNLEGLHY